MAQKTVKREQVPVELTWDLTPLFQDDQAFEEAFKALPDAWARTAEFKGRIAESAQSFKDFMQIQEDNDRALWKLFSYSSMRHDQDTANSQYEALKNRVMGLYAQLAPQVAFVTPELTAISKERFEEFVREMPELELYRHAMDVSWKRKEHVLSESEEAILARASEVVEAPETIFGVFDNADLKFPVIQDEKGEEIRLDHSNYGRLLESKDRRVRKDTFQNYYQPYAAYSNTFAAILRQQMKGDNFRADVRKFGSAREAALFNTHIPEEVHSRLIETVNEHLPLLHRYVALRKQLLKVDELHCYDLYVSVIDDVDFHFEIKEAEAIVLEAMAPLGPEYRAILERAFKERWIDYAVNEGKRSGAYSGGCYDSAPYILISWQGTLDNLYTLAHELGHSCHSYYTRTCQQPVYGDYGIFLAEIASTTNENLLTQYLLKKHTNPKERMAILNHYLDGFKGTVFRQTQFAEFEHWMHTEDQAGVPLTADHLKAHYAEMNQRYYGPALNQDPEIALEWERIPHFYYNYYVFQYATGFSAATAFSKTILEGGEAERERYLDYLRSGSSAYPIDVLKRAGLDMSTPEPIRAAMKVFETYLNELTELVGAQ